MYITTICTYSVSVVKERNKGVFGYQKAPLLLQEKYRENKCYLVGYKYIMCNVNGVLFC